MKKFFILSIVTVFVVISIALVLLQASAPDYKLSILESANVIMLILSLSAFYLVTRQIGKPGGAFVRGVSGATFLKLMVCMVGVLIFVATNKDTLHKPSIFVLMAIYALYSTVETILLSKMARTMK